MAGKVQAQEVVSQSSFYSSNDPRLHFGLGSAMSADLEIRWPNGNKESSFHLSRATNSSPSGRAPGIIPRSELAQALSSDFRAYR